MKLMVKDYATDSLSVIGIDSQTKFKVIEHLQCYNSLAIRSNTNDLQATKTALWAFNFINCLLMKDQLMACVPLI